MKNTNTVEIELSGTKFPTAIIIDGVHGLAGLPPDWKENRLIELKELNKNEKD